MCLADPATTEPINNNIPQMEIFKGFSIYRNLIIKFDRFYEIMKSR